MPILKNVRQEEFCHAMAEGKVTQTEAYIAAGYAPKAARVSASQLLTKPNITARIEEIRANIEKIEAEKQAKLEGKIGVTKAWVIEKLVTNVNRSLQEIPVLDHEGNHTGEYRYQGNVANKGCELIGKELGMFRDQPAEIKGDVHLHFGVPAPSWVSEGGDE